MVMIKRLILLKKLRKNPINHKKMKKYFFLLLASAALFVTSCSPFNVRTDYAETANFSSYKTYQFRVDDLKLNDLDKDRVLNEVAKNLQMKGLSASQTPDLVVN